MSNRRRTQPARNGAPASLRREADGTLTVVWPQGRPKVTIIRPEALEALVAAHNDAVLAAPADRPKQSVLARLGAWR